ncbi:MAG TPA: class I SAM-dependent methyltransferase [Candidatus Sulfotelmatobacter sp.]|nr:class I SAM-dependent methyltransferase [Candidatus Sulfotelmatobacter sp.]
MKSDVRWEEAQRSEVEFWDGMVRLEHGVLTVLAANCEKAQLLKRQLTQIPRKALEVGTGPFGIGIIGFLRDIPFRIATDPLPPSPINSDDLLYRYVAETRGAMEYVVACGEEIPARGESLDLVICCNVIDHASRPQAILQEVHRILRPGGLFFFDVHTFSALGLLKWHSWTKVKHREEMLVIAHPYRMFEAGIRRKMESQGFAVKKLTGHTYVSALIGQARISCFLGVKHAR